MSHKRLITSAAESRSEPRPLTGVGALAPWRRRTAVRPHFDYESIPPGYYDAVFRRRRGVQSKWHHLKFAAVMRELEGHRRVLDVGCGPGTLLGALGPGHDAVGVDLSRRQIEYARATHGGPARRFYAVHPGGLPEDEDGFDAVTLVELVEHLDEVDVERTLQEALARLRPGGKLVVTTPNFRSAWPAIEVAVNRLGGVSYDFQHINRFDARRLRELLEHHGLPEVSVRSYLLVAPFAATLGWQLADRVAALERRAQPRHAGLLLLATAVKPG